MKELQQITRNVFVNTQFSDPPLGRGANYSFVTTSAGLVMIDGPMLPTAAVSWQKELKARDKVRYLLNTEYHMDHVAGNYFFPEATVIAQEGVRTTLHGPVDGLVPFELGRVAMERGMDFRTYIVWRYEEMDPEGLKLAPDYEVIPPQITFSDRLTLHVGDHTFIMRHLPGHTPYQAAVYVPEEKVVFVGDNFSNNQQASLAQCLPLEWLDSLQKLEEMDFDYIVPGHGEVGDKAALRRFVPFIQGAVDTVREAIQQGVSKEEAAAKISFEKYMPPRHPGAEQQRMNIMRLYDLLSKK